MLVVVVSVVAGAVVVVWAFDLMSVVVVAIDALVVK
jgi:hypothetical protein